MAECSYARCLQKRRYIKRELMKWTKDMVYIVGLERVAEELMGRRKWKLYQEELARSQLNVNATNLVQNNTEDTSNRLDSIDTQEKLKLASPNQSHNLTENHINEDEVVTIRKDISENSIEKGCAVSERGTLAERNYDGPKGKFESSITKSQRGESDSESDAPCPIDWKPDDKCYFCVDGKLLTVNEKGDLVAESGPAPSEAELAHRQTSLDSDSDSSDSSPELEVQSHPGNSSRKSVTSLFRDSFPPNMTSLESMAAQLLAAAQLQRIQPDLSHIYPGHWYHQLAQQIQQATPPTSEINIPALSPSHKDSPSPSDITGEQPLDLSAKPSPNSSAGSNDPKQVFRAKPRVSAVAGRRTYSEEELNSALSDIMSGKLGTRRAAVQYGIPRSTLRNKVYKIAMEQKREVTSGHPPAMLEALVEQDDDDKDSGDEDKDDKYLGGSLDDQVDDLARYSAARLNSAVNMQNLRKACENNQVDMKPTDVTLEALTKRPQSVSSQPQTPPAMGQTPWIDPNLLLQTLLLSGGLGGLSALMQPKPEDQANMIPDILKRFMLQQQELINKQLKAAAPVTNDIMNNGKAGIPDPSILMQSFGMHPNSNPLQSQPHASMHYVNRIQKSVTPEVSLPSADLGDCNDDPSVILKIPSYKPVAGSSSSTSSGKNGEGLRSPTPQSTPPMLSRSPQQPNHMQGISPPLLRQNNDSQSPPIIGGKGMLSLRDVIAKSISRTFTQQAAKDPPHPLSKQPHMSDNHDSYKRPSISVIKSLGGSEFASAPNLLNSQANSGNNSQNQNNSNAGGKGTRPKRGKYRNYDRDSLVEAVRAVQRGEMSVHRAGSYYGVPHSTLEYKVKERHLMRPRKREPKPQPLDDRSGSGSASNSTNSKNANIPGLVGSSDKSKSSTISQNKASLKNNPPYPSTSPNNGMKVPLFDSALASAQLPYPNIFWPSHGFGPMPIDFARTAGCRQSSPAGFPPNAESFLASTVMQQFQEESNRHNTNSASSTLNAPTTPTPPASVSGAGIPANSKRNNLTPVSASMRDIPESRFDPVGANGSFLDGIIRQSLERNTNDIPHGVLLDQLVKNSRLLTGSNCSNDSSVSGSKGSAKRSMSPMLFPAVDIKRERTSPTLNLSNSDAEISSRERDISQESVESLLKMRDGLSLKADDKLHHTSPSLLHHHQSLQQHHVQQSQPQSFHLQQSQISSSASKHMAVEEVNGSINSNSSATGGQQQQLEKIGQIKTEAEDSL